MGQTVAACASCRKVTTGLRRMLCAACYSREQRAGRLGDWPRVNGDAQAALEAVMRYNASRDDPHDLPPGIELVGDCLVWKLAHHHDGRGFLWLDGEKRLVGHLVLERFVGVRPSAAHTQGHVANAHGCAGPACALVDHLGWQTPVEQAEQRRTDGTLLAGERAPGAKLSEAQARWALECELSSREAAARLGVSGRTIRDLRAGRTWAALHG